MQQHHRLEGSLAQADLSDLNMRGPSVVFLNFLIKISIC